MRHCVQFIAKFLTVSSHALGASRGPQPGSRSDPTDLVFAVVVFISLFHVVGGTPRVLRQSGLGIAYRALCGSRLLGIRRKCPSHLVLFILFGCSSEFNLSSKRLFSYSLVSYSLIPSYVCYLTKVPMIKNLKPLEVSDHLCLCIIARIG